MDAIIEARLWANLRAYGVPGGIIVPNHLLPKQYVKLLGEHLFITEHTVRGTRAMKRKLSPAMIQKQEQMRQQTVEKGMQIIPRQDLPFVE